VILNEDIRKVMAFFQSSAKHVKENLVPAIASPKSDVTNCLTENATSVLLGLPLSTSQFLSIESPVLQEIISEEPGFESTPAGKTQFLVLPKSGVVVTSAVSNDSGFGEGSGTAPGIGFLENLRSVKHMTAAENLYSIIKKEELWEQQKKKAKREKEDDSISVNREVGKGESVVAQVGDNADYTKEENMMSHVNTESFFDIDDSSCAPQNGSADFSADISEAPDENDMRFFARYISSYVDV